MGVDPCVGRGPGVCLSSPTHSSQTFHLSVSELWKSSVYSLELPCRAWGGGAVSDEDREMGPCHCGDGGQWEPLKACRKTVAQVVFCFRVCSSQCGEGWRSWEDRSSERDFCTNMVL